MKIHVQTILHFIGSYFFAISVMNSIDILYASSSQKPVYQILAEKEAKAFIEREREVADIHLELNPSWKLSSFEEKTKEFSEKNQEYERFLNGYRQNFQQEIKNESDQKIKKFYLDVLRIVKGDLRTLAGGIDYTMSLDEMKKVVQDTFAKMKNKSKAAHEHLVKKESLTKEEFEKIKNDLHATIISSQEFSKIKGYYYGPSALDRAWVAEYLREKIKKNNDKMFAVPHWLIVTKDHNPIKVIVKFTEGVGFPWVFEFKKDQFDPGNADLYFENIEGEAVANKFEGPLRQYGYIDTVGPAGNANARCKGMMKKTSYGSPECEGIVYILDLELKSLSQEEYPFKGIESAGSIFNENFVKRAFEYADKKFHYLNGDKIIQPNATDQYIVDIDGQ